MLSWGGGGSVGVSSFIILEKGVKIYLILVHNINTGQGGKHTLHPLTCSWGACPQPPFPMPQQFYRICSRILLTLLTNP